MLLLLPVAEGAKQAMASVNSEDGKIKEEVHNISCLINRSLKLQVTFCLTSCKLQLHLTLLNPSLPVGFKHMWNRIEPIDIG